MTFHFTDHAIKRSAFRDIEYEDCTERYILWKVWCMSRISCKLNRLTIMILFGIIKEAGGPRSILTFSLFLIKKIASRLTDQKFRFGGFFVNRSIISFGKNEIQKRKRKNTKNIYRKLYSLSCHRNISTLYFPAVFMCLKN